MAVDAPPSAASRGWETLVAKVGSTVLAAPGTYGVMAVVAAVAATLDSGDPLVRPWHWAGAVTFAAVGGCGFALLRGYWRVRSGRMARERQAQFWKRSATYNAVLSLLLAVYLVWWLSQTSISGIGVGLGVALLAWTAWMTWSGLRCASAVSTRPEP